ncbi:MAG: TonB-dependent receptor, partial [Rikenellaceae bacterium]|nr:TonB-dependent receptor [Rikenellaceae bacterium]
VYNQYSTTISRLANPNLNWERTYHFNAGVDLRIFDNLINGAFEFYSSESNAVSRVTVGEHYVVTVNVPINGTHIINEGFEATVHLNPPIRSKDFNLTVSMNFSKNWNRVAKIRETLDYNINTTSYLNCQTDRILEKGYAVGDFWAYDFQGLDSNGTPLFNRINYNTTDEELSYLDFLVYAGSRLPSITSGITFRLSYKSFVLNTQFAAILGQTQMLPTPFTDQLAFGYLPDPDVNLSWELNNRWRYIGDEQWTVVPRVGLSGSPVDPSGMTNSLITMWDSSSIRRVNGNYLRCKNIQLSWFAPKKILEGLGIQRLGVSLSTTDVFVLKSRKFKGMDPETGTSVTPRSFTFGLDIGF